MRSLFRSSLVLACSLVVASCESPFSTSPAAPDSPEPGSVAFQAGGFPIDVRFVGDVPADVRDAAQAAATRWMRVVVGPANPIDVDQSAAPCAFAPVLKERVRGVVIFVRMSAADSLATAGANGGACGVRSNSLISYEGVITVSTPGLANSRAANYLGTILLHEMGHVLGIGTNWFASPYLHDAKGSNPTFAGPNAMQAAFDVGISTSAATPVPISRPGESGAFTHWRTPNVGNDIMLSGGGTALTVVSAGALRDLGYTVSLAAVDRYDAAH
jgi:hypothetical protein